jgi:hypothetical protein
MNYLKVYHQLISKAQHRHMSNDIYIERHHIIPLSLKGEDIDLNIVSLTAKEHFVAHHLLWKIHRNPPMTKAFMLMCNTKRNGVKYKISAKEYQVLKEEFSKSQSDAVKSRPGNNLGKTLSQEWRDNISKGLMGRPGGNHNTPGFRGKHHTEENKKAISERRKGVGTHFTPHTEETKATMSVNRKGKSKQPWTEERKEARSILMQEIHKKRKEEKSPD